MFFHPHPQLLFHLCGYFSIPLAVSSMPPATFPILPSICALVKPPVASSHSPHPAFHHRLLIVPSPAEGFFSPTSQMHPFRHNCIPVLPQLHPLHLSHISVFSPLPDNFLSPYPPPCSGAQADLCRLKYRGEQGISFQPAACSQNPQPSPGLLLCLTLPPWNHYSLLFLSASC